MRILAPALLSLALLSTSAQAVAPQRVTGEARLAQMIEGRVAGEPVNCINLRQIRSSTVIDDTAIVYDAGGTLYVNRPRSGAESLNRFDTLVTRTHASQLCNVDVVQTVDLPSRMMTGLVFLGEFVPYRRAR